MKYLSNYPNLSVIIASFFWGTYWIPLRYINSAENYSTWPVIVCFLILPLILIKPLYKSLLDFSKKKDLYYLFGNIFSALGIALYTESLLRGEISKVVIIFYLCPVWGTILAKFLLKQNFNFNRYLALILGLVGLEIVLGFDKGIFFPSTLEHIMALLGGITWAIGVTFFHLSKSTSGIEKLSVTSLFIPIFLLLLTIIPGHRELDIFQINISFYIFIILILVFCIIWILPSLLLKFVSVEILDPGRLNILLMFEVVVGIGSAALLTNETIGFREIIGAIIIISAGTIDLIKFDKFFNIKKFFKLN